MATYNPQVFKDFASAYKADTFLRRDLRDNYPSSWKVLDESVPLFLEYAVRIFNREKQGFPTLGAQKLANMLVSTYAASPVKASEFANAFGRGVRAGAIPASISSPVETARGISVANTTNKAIAIKQKAEDPSFFDKLSENLEGIGSSAALAGKAFPWLLILAAGTFVYVTYGRPLAAATRPRMRRQ